MAKRTIRNTDSQDTMAPERRRRAAGENGHAAPRARASRTRRAAQPAQTDSIEARAAAAGPGLDAAGPDEITASSSTAPFDVPHDHIAVRAYHLYLERGGRGGDDFQDWITAERQLRERAAGNRLR